MTDDNLKKAESYAMRLLRFRPRSVQELRLRLKNKGFNSTQIEQAIVHLKSCGLLDDRRFAEFWVKDRELSGSTGAKRIRYELKAKGLSETIVNEALSDFESRIDEYSIARAFVEKRLNSLEGLDSIIKKRRLTYALTRRGFSYDTIERLIGELIKDSRLANISEF